MADQIFSMYTFLKPACAAQTSGLGQVPSSKFSKIQSEIQKQHFCDAFGMTKDKKRPICCHWQN